MAAFAAALIPFFWWSLLTSSFTEGTVLDPSLYLLPSPPLVTNDDPGEQWSQPTRVTRDAGTHEIEMKPTTTEEPDAMESAETFWPSLRTSYGLGGIHIPLTFSVSGTYGSGYTGYGTGVVGSGYASSSIGTGHKYANGLMGTGVVGTYSSVSADEPASVKSGLAGSSYGTYGSGYPGVRLYGNSGKTGWSGWGNGKWGHYGKG